MSASAPSKSRGTDFAALRDMPGTLSIVQTTIVKGHGVRSEYYLMECVDEHIQKERKGNEKEWRMTACPLTIVVWTSFHRGKLDGHTLGQIMTRADSLKNDSRLTRPEDIWNGFWKAKPIGGRGVKIAYLGTNCAKDWLTMQTSGARYPLCLLRLITCMSYHLWWPRGSALGTVAGRRVTRFQVSGADFPIKSTKISIHSRFMSCYQACLGKASH